MAVVQMWETRLKGEGYQESGGRSGGTGVSGGTEAREGQEPEEEVETVLESKRRLTEAVTDLGSQVFLLVLAF